MATRIFDVDLSGGMPVDAPVVTANEPKARRRLSDIEEEKGD